MTDTPNHDGTDAVDLPKHRHECGLFAAVCLKGARDLFPIVLDGLQGLQHRGQDAAGLLFRGVDGRLVRVASTGLVRTVMEELPPVGLASAAIGHVRYATFGSRGGAGAQPVLAPVNRGGSGSRFDPASGLGFAFAGHVAELGADGAVGSARDWASDALMLADRLWHRMQRVGLPTAVDELLDNVDGAVNLLALRADGAFVAARDRYGFRPLHWGVRGDLLLVSSEDHILRALGCASRELGPGERLSTQDGAVQRTSAGHRRPAACSFEYVYFAHPAASFDHRSVHAVRERFGELLAEEEPLRATAGIVVPIPATGTVAGRAFAQRLGLPVRDGIVTDRYHTRTFIGRQAPTAGIDKHHIVPNCARNQDTFLVDDSLVRGATLSRLVANFRRIARPRSVHVRIAAPPVLHPCFYGIDIPTRRQLMAAGLRLDQPDCRGLERLADELGVDSVRYLSLAGFRRAFAPGSDRLCYACLDGNYPTPAGGRMARLDAADYPPSQRPLTVSV
jgi:amidophosphoribosyltransferase